MIEKNRGKDILSSDMREATSLSRQIHQKAPNSSVMKMAEYTRDGQIYTRFSVMQPPEISLFVNEPSSHVIEFGPKMGDMIDSYVTTAVGEDGVVRQYAASADRLHMESVLRFPESYNHTVDFLGNSELVLKEEIEEFQEKIIFEEAESVEFADELGLNVLSEQEVAERFKVLAEFVGVDGSRTEGGGKISGGKGVATVETVDLLKGAIEKLSEQQVVQMSGFVVDGWTYHLVSEAENGDPHSVKLHRSRKKQDRKFSENEEWNFSAGNKPVTFVTYDRAEIDFTAVSRGESDPSQIQEYNRAVRRNKDEAERMGATIATREQIANGLAILRNLAKADLGTIEE